MLSLQCEEKDRRLVTLFPEDVLSAALRED